MQSDAVKGFFLRTTRTALRRKDSHSNRNRSLGHQIEGILKTNTKLLPRENSRTCGAEKTSQLGICRKIARHSISLIGTLSPESKAASSSHSHPRASTDSRVQFTKSGYINGNPSRPCTEFILSSLFFPSPTAGCALPFIENDQHIVRLYHPIQDSETLSSQQTPEMLKSSAQRFHENLLRIQCYERAQEHMKYRLVVYIRGNLGIHSVFSPTMRRYLPKNVIHVDQFSRDESMKRNCDEPQHIELTEKKEVNLCSVRSQVMSYGDVDNYCSSRSHLLTILGKYTV